MSQENGSQDEINGAEEPNLWDDMAAEANSWSGESVTDIPRHLIDNFPEILSSAERLRNTVPPQYQGEARGPEISISETNSLATVRHYFEVLAVDRAGNALTVSTASYAYEGADGIDYRVMPATEAYERLRALRNAATNDQQTTQPTRGGIEDEEQFNKDLHSRIADGINDGTIRVVDNGIRADTNPLVDQLVNNRQAGRPLFDGAKVYRGSKDPDVDAGTFDATVKHATPRYATALGYAETANQHIGLASKATRGIGMLAEYELPKDAVFYRNFGLEGAARAGQNSAALTIHEAEKRIAPLVEAVVNAGDEVAARSASAALAAYCDRELYELAVPAEQKPVRQWVVQSDERGSRLLENQDRGTLADVLTDVVRARKAAVDEYSATRVSDHMRASSTTAADMIEAVAPGVSTAIKLTAEHLDQKLESIHEQTFNTPHESLSSAIDWRRDAQRSMELHRLNNSGTTIQSSDPALSAVPEIEEALLDVERAATRQEWLPTLEELHGLFEAGERTAAEIERARQAREEISRQEAAARAALETTQGVREKAAQTLAELEQQHARALSGNIVQRTAYRIGQQKATLEELAIRGEHVAALDSTVAKLAHEWKEVAQARTVTEAAVVAKASKLDNLERQFKEREREGDLTYLPPDAQAQATRYTKPDWAGLAKAAESGIQASAELIEKGRESAGLFHAVAARGLEAGLEQHRNRKVTSANNSVQIATKTDGEWSTLRVLDTNGLAKGIHYLEDAVDPSKNVHPQKFGGAVVHSDAEHVYQIAPVGIVKHDASMFPETPKIGQCYEVAYFRGVGSVKGELTQEQGAKLAGRQGVRM